MHAIFMETSAPVTKLAELNDRISNTQSAVQSRWGFEFKICRFNSASKDPNATTPVLPENEFLYTLNFSHYPDELFVLSQGRCTVLEGDFDAMMMTKLQSLWTPRQTYKGDGTFYEINNGEFVLRVANLTLLGAYKGLVVHVEYLGNNPDKSTDRINELMEMLGLQLVDNLIDKSRLNMAWKYIEALTR